MALCCNVASKCQFILAVPRPTLFFLVSLRAQVQIRKSRVLILNRAYQAGFNLAHLNRLNSLVNPCPQTNHTCINLFETEQMMEKASTQRGRVPNKFRERST